MDEGVTESVAVVVHKILSVGEEGHVPGAGTYGGPPAREIQRLAAVAVEVDAVCIGVVAEHSNKDVAHPIGVVRNQVGGGGLEGHVTAVEIQ